MKKFFTTLLLFCSLALSAHAESAITFITENTPPLNFMKGDKVVGITSEVVLELMKKVGQKIKRDDLQMLNWEVGYSRAQQEPNTALFSVARMPNREALFRWVGPVTRTSLGLIARTDANITLSSIEDAKQYVIGTVSETAPEQLLLMKYGFDVESLVRQPSSEQNIDLLMHNQVDIIACNVPTFFFNVQEQGLDKADFSVVATLMEADLYIAFHPETDLALINSLNQALVDLKTPDSSGKSEFDKIIQKYVSE